MIHHSQPYFLQTALNQAFEQLSLGQFSSSILEREFLSMLEKDLSAGSIALTASCSAALFYALQFLNRPKGSKIILPTYVCENVLNSVLLNEFQPVLCDSGEHWVITAESVEQVFSQDVVAIILPSIFGIKIDVASFRRFNVPLIYDVAQCYDAIFDACQGIDCGDLMTLSFGPTKCLSLSTGGALIGLNPAYNKQVSLLRESKHYLMNTLDTTLGMTLIQNYQTLIEQRNKIACLYFNHISPRFTQRLQVLQDNSSFYRFPLWLDSLNLDRMFSECLNLGVTVRRGVDALLHRVLGLGDEDYPHAVNAFNSTASIPIYPSLTEDEALTVISAVSKVLPV